MSLQYAAWDLALQMIPFANIDAEFAMSQLELLLGDGYLHPGGQVSGSKLKCVMLVFGYAHHESTKGLGSFGCL